MKELRAARAENVELRRELDKATEQSPAKDGSWRESIGKKQIITRTEEKPYRG